MLHPHRGQDRPKDLIGVYRHVGRDVVEQGGAEEIAILKPVNHEITAVGDQQGSLLFTGVDVPTDPVEMLTGHQWAHLDSGLIPGADSEFLDASLHVFDEPIAGFTHRHYSRDGHTPLPGRAVPGRDRGIGGQVHIRIRKHDHVILCSTKGLDSLAVPGAGLVDVAGNRS